MASARNGYSEFEERTTNRRTSWQARMSGAGLGGAGARMSSPGPALLLKSKGPNQTTASFISVLLLTLHFLRPFLPLSSSVLVVGQSRLLYLYSDTNCAQVCRLCSRQPCESSNKHSVLHHDCMFASTFTDSQFIQQAPSCCPHPSVFPLSLLAPLSSSSSPSLYTLPHCCAGSNASAINMKSLSRSTC